MSDTRCTPGATTSGFARASNHVGPRELNAATLSPSRVIEFFVSTAPTAIDEGALAGELMPV